MRVEWIFSPLAGPGPPVRDDRRTRRVTDSHLDPLADHHAAGPRQLVQFREHGGHLRKRHAHGSRPVLWIIIDDPLIGRGQPYESLGQTQGVVLDQHLGLAGLDPGHQTEPIGVLVYLQVEFLIFVRTAEQRSRPRRRKGRQDVGSLLCRAGLQSVDLRDVDQQPVQDLDRLGPLDLIIGGRDLTDLRELAHDPLAGPHIPPPQSVAEIDRIRRSRERRVLARSRRADQTDERVERADRPDDRREHHVGRDRGDRPREHTSHDRPR